MPRPDRVIEPIEDDFDSVVSNAAQPLRKNKRKQTQRNEGLTEQWVNHTLHDLGYFKNETLIVEPKKSEKPQIQKLLSNATENLDHFQDYAVDGARLYADYLSKELDVLYIGVSGQTEKGLRISHYIKHHGKKEHKEILRGCGLQDFPTYVEQLKNQRFRVDYSTLLEYIGGLNKQLHGKRIPE